MEKGRRANAVLGRGPERQLWATPAPQPRHRATRHRTAACLIRSLRPRCSQPRVGGHPETNCHAQRPPQACPAELPSARWSHRWKCSCSTFYSSPGRSSRSSTPAGAAAVRSALKSATLNGGRRCSCARSEPAGRALGAHWADLMCRRCRAAAQAAARNGLTHARVHPLAPLGSRVVAPQKKPQSWPAEQKKRQNVTPTAT